MREFNGDFIPACGTFKRFMPAADVIRLFGNDLVFVILRSVGRQYLRRYIIIKSFRFYIGFFRNLVINLEENFVVYPAAAISVIVKSVITDKSETARMKIGRSLEYVNLGYFSVFVRHEFYRRRSVNFGGHSRIRLNAYVIFDFRNNGFVFRNIAEFARNYIDFSVDYRSLVLEIISVLIVTAVKLPFVRTNRERSYVSVFVGIKSERVRPENVLRFFGNGNEILAGFGNRFFCSLPVFAVGYEIRDYFHNALRFEHFQNFAGYR